MSQQTSSQLTPQRQATLQSLGRFFYCNLKQALDVHANLKRGKLFAHELKKEFSTQAEREFLKTLLTDRQWEDLKRLIEIIKTEKVTIQFVDSGPIDSKITSRRELSTYEKQVRNLILDNRQPLQAVLNLSKLDDITYEYNLESFGRADMWVLANKISYPIEIKDETADVKVVPQILKYVKGSIQLMHQGWYDWVIGVVIAPAFSEQAIRDLKSIDCIPLQIVLTKDSYTLEQV